MSAMASAEGLLDEVAGQGGRLEVHGDGLRLIATQGAFSDELLQALREHKGELLGLLRERSREGPGTPAMADPAHDHEPFPLTDLQHAYWLGRVGGLRSSRTGVHTYLEFDCERLDVGRLEAALHGLIERHDMLRAVLDVDSGQQRVLPAVPHYRIGVDDQSQAVQVDAERAVQATRDGMSHQVFDWARWPLFDIRVTAMPAHRARLHVSLHLLFLDAASVGLFFHQWHRLYRDPQAELPHPDITFRDCVLAAERRRGGSAYQQAQTYWFDRLEALPAAPALPVRTDDEQGGDDRFSRRCARIGRARWSGLKTASRRRGITPASLLLALYAEVLARWSSTAHFTVNVTASGRAALGAQAGELMGAFTTLVLHEVDRRVAPPRFADFAQRVQRRLLEDLAHLEVSGVEVSREWNRLHGRAPRVSMPVVFNCLLPGEGAAGVGDIDDFGRRAYGSTQTSQVWLHGDVLESQGDLLLQWDAVDAAFEPGVLDAMFSAFTQTIERLADDESCWEQAHIVELPGEMARRRVMANQTACPVPEGRLHAGLVQHALSSPQALAVLSPARTMTYGELLRESVAVADWLLERDLRAGQPVAVLMHKGWEQLVAVYGVLLAGGAYLPVDADLPAQRQAELLRLAEVAHALTQPESVLPAEAASGVSLLTVRAGTQGCFGAEHQRSLDASADALAYVIFTSGTTGVPKGVMIDHRAALNTVEYVNRRFEVTARDRVLAVSSLSFDLSVYDIFGLHRAGAAVVLPDHRRGNDPAHWHELIREHGVTLWNSAPQLMHLLADADAGEAYGALRLMLLSGDVIPVDLPARARVAYPHAQVVSLGGATEASIWSICHPIDQVDPTWARIPYGLPLPNQTVWVCDEWLRPCPDHVIGHIYIGGSGLARGYWRNEAETVARFVRHPQSGERWYATGDLGRYRPDGLIEILGRDDGQVKIRGHRVELGEIEAVLQRHAAVRQAVVLAPPGPVQGRQLVAYLECAKGGVAATEVRHYLAERLPEYMVPHHVVVMPAMPVTANGKIDRRALPAVTEEQAEQARDIVVPRNETEHALHGAWTQVMPGAALGVADDFFAIGGDSLMAVQLVRAINAALPSFRLEMHELFECPTIAGLANLYSKRGGRNALLPNVQPASQQVVLGDIQAGSLNEMTSEVAWSRVAAPEVVLLTGATGWIGSHVLRELLSKTRAKVMCLVRARHGLAGMERLRAAARAHGVVIEESCWERVEPVAGDLAQPGLALDPAAWQRLAASVDAIYHLGASTNVFADYQALRQVNVLATATIVQLAVEHHGKALFLCSPKTVNKRLQDGKVSVWPEERVYGEPEGLLTGYAQSKWAAERIVHSAFGCGLPVKIYRSSHALPASAGGRAPLNDTFMSVLQATCAAGVVPDWADSAFHGVPVDTLSRLLVADSLSPGVHAGVVHIEHREPLNLGSVARALSQGSEPARVPLPEWRARCLEASSRLPAEVAALVRFLFAPGPGGAAVEHLFCKHPIDTAHFERRGQLHVLSNLTPPDYWHAVRRTMGW